MLVLVHQLRHHEPSFAISSPPSDAGPVFSHSTAQFTEPNAASILSTAATLKEIDILYCRSAGLSVDSAPLALIRSLLTLSQLLREFSSTRRDCHICAHTVPTINLTSRCFDSTCPLSKSLDTITDKTSTGIISRLRPSPGQLVPSNVPSIPSHPCQCQRGVSYSPVHSPSVLRHVHQLELAWAYMILGLQFSEARALTCNLLHIGDRGLLYPAAFGGLFHED